MLPALTEAVRNAARSIRESFGSDPIALGIEEKGGGAGVSFDAVSAGWYARNGFPGIYSILSGGMPAWSGEPVSIETALNHSVVFGCKRLISGSTGLIPALMLQEKKGETQPAVGHPMRNAFLHAPNDEITAQGFTELLTGHALMEGNGYAQIIRRSGTGTAVELRPLLPQIVFPDREKAGQKRLIYVIKDGNSADKTYTVQKGKPQDILHLRGEGWDGIRGYSVITMGRQSIGTAISSERNVARFYANGGRAPYNLKLTNKFPSIEKFDQFRADWERVYSEPHKAPILESWVDYQSTGMTAVDAQMLETRQFHISEICRWFGVSPHLVGDLSRATFSNVENLALQFGTFTLLPWLNRWEEEFWRCVLTDEEKAAGYILRHDTDALLRGDFASRMAGYATALQNGFLNVDEVRAKEGRNPLPNGAGEDYHIQLNMQALPADGPPPSTGNSSLVRLGQPKPAPAPKEVIQ